jgi:hypothetical protein
MALSTISQLKTDKTYDENSLLEANPPIWVDVSCFHPFFHVPFRPDLQLFKIWRPTVYTSECWAQPCLSRLTNSQL